MARRGLKKTTVEVVSMDDISADYSAFNVGNSAAQTDQIAIATGVKSI